MSSRDALKQPWWGLTRSRSVSIPRSRGDVIPGGSCAIFFLRYSCAVPHLHRSPFLFLSHLSTGTVLLALFLPIDDCISVCPPLRSPRDNYRAAELSFVVCRFPRSPCFFVWNFSPIDARRITTLIEIFTSSSFSEFY